MLELQRRVQTFENLGSEISGCSAEWKEYFNVSYERELEYVP